MHKTFIQKAIYGIMNHLDKSYIGKPIELLK